jgi:hypothetical protein
MVRISVLYATSEGKKFDHDYYVKTHMKLVRDCLNGFGLVRTEVDKGLGLMGDVPNFTNIQPQVQISEIIG